MAAVAPGYQNCVNCGAPVDLGGNSEAGNLMRVSFTPGRDPSAQNKNAYETIPRVLVPQPLSQHGDGQVQLVFASPFTAGSPYNSNSLGEIGSNNPASTAYSRRVEYRALYATPLFDLRPELGASQATTSALPINRGNAYGQGSRLILQLERGQAGNADERFYNYQFADFTALVEPTRLFQTCAPQSITASIRNTPIVADDGTSMVTTLLPFQAPANPVRFWQLWIIVDVIANDLVPNAAPAPHKISWWAG